MYKLKRDSESKDENADSEEAQIDKENSKQEYREKVKSSFGIKRYKDTRSY